MSPSLMLGDTPVWVNTARFSRGTQAPREFEMRGGFASFPRLPAVAGRRRGGAPDGGGVRGGGGGPRKSGVREDKSERVRLVSDVVGGEMEGGVGPHPGGEKVEEVRLDESALVMPGFGPRVGKENVDGGEGLIGEGGEEEAAVSVEDADVGEGVVGEAVQASGDAVDVDFGADESGVGVEGREIEEVFAVSESDFKGERFLRREVSRCVVADGDSVFIVLGVEGVEARRAHFASVFAAFGVVVDMACHVQRVAETAPKFLNINKETDEVRPLALVRLNFRLLKQPLKRTAPTCARRRCLQKKLN